MKPRLATIDLDWLEGEIKELKDYIKRLKDDRVFPSKVVFETSVKTFELIRSKCIHVEESKVNLLFDYLLKYEDNPREAIIVDTSVNN